MGKNAYPARLVYGMRYDSHDVCLFDSNTGEVELIKEGNHRQLSMIETRLINKAHMRMFVGLPDLLYMRLSTRIFDEYATLVIDGEETFDFRFSGKKRLVCESRTNGVGCIIDTGYYMTGIEDIYFLYIEKVKDMYFVIIRLNMIRPTGKYVKIDLKTVFSDRLEFGIMGYSSNVMIEGFNVNIPCEVPASLRSRFSLIFEGIYV